jgi:Flp pilus assembly protein TadG
MRIRTAGNGGNAVKTHWSSRFPFPSAGRGQSLVEFALILPTFLLLVLGTVDLGRAFYESVAVHGAAEAGSLVAAEYGQSEASVRSKIKASTNPDIFPFLQIQDAEIDITLDTSSTGKDTEYSITVTRNFQLLTPFIGSVFGNQALTLRSVARGRRNCATTFC